VETSNATRALTLEGALSCLDVSKARLRSGLTTQAAENQAGQCTRYEDWLEVSHPRSPLRGRLKTVRRRLEDRGHGR
jgi:hypothetical protein